MGTGVKTGTNTAVAFLIDITAATLSTGNVQVSSVAIAPNPVKNVLNILGQKIESAEIYNVTGQKLKTIKIVDNKADVSFLSKGIYILQVTADGQKPVSYTHLDVYKRQSQHLEMNPFGTSGLVKILLQ